MILRDRTYMTYWTYNMSYMTYWTYNKSYMTYMTYWSYNSGSTSLSWMA